jgi:3-oxoacyl-[acyl-carrier-protein] synthase-3
MSASIITGTGSYIPETRKRNLDFIQQLFFSEEKKHITIDKQLIAEKFAAITGIQERRYAIPSQLASDMGALAGKLAIEDSGIDAESLDLLIVAHNFGDVSLWQTK